MRLSRRSGWRDRRTPFERNARRRLGQTGRREVAIVHRRVGWLPDRQTRRPPGRLRDRLAGDRNRAHHRECLRHERLTDMKYETPYGELPWTDHPDAYPDFSHCPSCGAAVDVPWAGSDPRTRGAAEDIEGGLDET